jgi:hypothetical protein
VQLLGVQNAMFAAALLPLVAIVLMAEMRTTPASDSPHRFGLSLPRVPHWRRRGPMGV